MPEIVVRKLAKPEEFLEAVEVQKKAWRMNDYKEAAPAHLLRALADNGGLVLGLFYNGKLVGVSYGWPASYYFYSHATGVVEGEKYRGLGYTLKEAQREHVLREYGFSLAKWTFDPLQSLNSRFNLAKLGVIAREYYVDYYGEITDPINKGLGTDRVKAEWWLTSERVVGERRSSKPCPRVLEELGAVAAFGVETREGVPRPGARRSEEELLNAEVVLVPIPRSISEVRDASPSIAREWREATRWAYSLLINNGYILVDNLDGGIGYTLNVLWKTDPSTVLQGPEPWRRC